MIGEQLNTVSALGEKETENLGQRQGHHQPSDLNPSGEQQQEVFDLSTQTAIQTAETASLSSDQLRSRPRSALEGTGNVDDASFYLPRQIVVGLTTSRPQERDDRAG